MNRHLGSKKGHFDANDAESILIWKELKEKNGDVKVLCHKKQGELDPKFPGLKKDDFLLCFMTIHQKMLVSKLMSRKHNIVMMDATHGTNQYDFKMVTVMTKNLNHQGEPLAHMFSTTENGTALQFFCNHFELSAEKLNARHLCPTALHSTSIPGTPLWSIKVMIHQRSCFVPGMSSKLFEEI